MAIEGSVPLAPRAPVSQDEWSHSCWGSDGVYYPAEEERKVPFSDAALRLLVYLYQALNYLFGEHPDVYVGADQFFYWEPGDPTQRVAPDGYVIFGIPKRPLRTSIRVWEEAPPVFVTEISNADSREEDRGHKFLVYQDVLCVPNYLIYDHDKKEILFYRLQDGQYVRQQTDEKERYYCPELNVWFGQDPELEVRVYGPDTRPVPASGELFRRLEETEQSQEVLRRIARRYEEELAEVRERQAAEAVRLQSLLETEQRRAHEQQRRAEEERHRADALAAELERLRRGNGSPEESV